MGFLRIIFDQCHQRRDDWYLGARRERRQLGTAMVAPPADGHAGNGGSAVLNNSTGTAVLTGSGRGGGPPYAGRGGDGGSAIVNGGSGGIVCTGNGGEAGQPNGKGGKGWDNPCWEATCNRCLRKFALKFVPTRGVVAMAVIALPWKVGRRNQSTNRAASVGASCGGAIGAWWQSGASQE
jgi:hypothetical protein